ncbi:unnamed protein product [Onchocerca flexuosa]|uniref:Uncharacterized protein n=1 Tax=Onchocerca flexuosa TaxID=387005 RepID=A0A183I8F0_9BILA|nr:unnamed protein product [Onchocerca flexuosa]
MTRKFVKRSKFFAEFGNYIELQLARDMCGLRDFSLYRKYRFITPDFSRNSVKLR